MSYKEKYIALSQESKRLWATTKESYLKKRTERTQFIKALDIKSYDFQLSTWFGSGLIIPAPGTWGTFGGLIFGLLLWFLTNGFFVFLASIILFYMGLKSVERLEKKLSEHDSSFIVIDEVSAILLVLSYNSLVISWFESLNIKGNFPIIIIATTFALFRYFDAKKPGYIGVVDRETKGAWGVMLDDTIAAIYAIFASILLFIAFHFLTIFMI